MVSELTGLPGDWLNGWLAAVGLTVLLPGRRIGWTTGASPVAVVNADLPALAGEVLDTLPTREGLERLAIARRRRDADSELPRAVTRQQFRARAALARADPYLRDLSLEATVTDLVAEDTEHSPFDPPMPAGVTLWQRLVTLREAVQRWDAEAVVRSLGGNGRRIEGNGLGFDARRFAAGVQPAAKVAVDPIVELLAFWGCGLFPVRGDLRTARTRGWARGSQARRSFTWPLWQPLLDRWSIDALLDRVYDSPSSYPARRRSGPPHGEGSRTALAPYGVTALFATVPIQPRGSSDVNRGYASERVW